MPATPARPPAACAPRLANIVCGSGARRLRLADAGRDADGRMVGLRGPVEDPIALPFGGLFVKPDRVLHQLLDGWPQHITRGIDRHCARRPRAAGLGILDDDAAKLTHASWQAPRASTLLKSCPGSSGIAQRTAFPAAVQRSRHAAAARWPVSLTSLAALVEPQAQLLAGEQCLGREPRQRLVNTDHAEAGPLRQVA